MIFPALAIDPSGFTRFFESKEECERMPVGYIGIFNRHKGTIQLFDSASTVRELRLVALAEQVSLWTRLFKSLTEVAVTFDFDTVREVSVEDFKSALRRAVDADDDILTQFKPRDKILNRLDRAKSIPDIFSTYRWMRKE